MQDPAQGPFTFTYAVGPGFLSNQGPNLPPGVAREVVANVLQSWTIASHGYLNFTLAPWDAVMNDGAAPPDQWEGPSLDQWLTGDFPGVYPGWGANFEFFSVPTGFALDSQGVHYQLGPNNLGFTVVNRQGSSHIVSVDIYLNEDFTWFDSHTASNNGSADPPPNNAYDISTVLLHEMGHAFGLDHPNQAAANGSVNLDPYVYAPGESWSPTDLMYSYYQGVRDHPTVDEVGGVAFLYQLPSPLDVNGDGFISGADIGMVLVNWNLEGLGRPGDINYDGVVNAFDLSILLINFNPGSEPMPVQTHPLDPRLDDPSTNTTVSPVIFDCYHVPTNGTAIEENQGENKVDQHTARGLRRP